MADDESAEGIPIALGRRLPLPIIRPFESGTPGVRARENRCSI
jgi:hypothetical protein